MFTRQQSGFPSAGNLLNAMLFAIDIGNSHTVIGLFEGRELRHHWRLQTDRRATADEINKNITTIHQISEETEESANLTSRASSDLSGLTNHLYGLVKQFKI